MNSLRVTEESVEKGLMAESAFAIAEVEFELKHWERATAEALNAAAEFHGESERDQQARANVLAARIRLAEGQCDAANTIDRQVLDVRRSRQTDPYARKRRSLKQS